MALHWKLAELLKEYLQGLENNENQMEGIVWAKQKVDWFDPVKKAPDNLLNDGDRNKLMKYLLTSLIKD